MFKKIGAFLIIRIPVDTLLEFRIVHAKRMHDYLDKDAYDRLTGVTLSKITAALVRVPHLVGVLVDILNNLGSKKIMIKFKAFVCVINVV